MVWVVCMVGVGKLGKVVNVVELMCWVVVCGVS